MSFDMNSLPDDVEELKRIIIFEKNKILEYQEQLQLQRQKEVEYREELRLQKLKESEHLEQIERLKIQLFGRKESFHTCQKPHEKEDWKKTVP